MIQTAIDYAKELHKAGMTHEELSSVKDIFDVVPQVKEELNDPTVSLEKKHLVIQKVFSKNVRNFLQLLCDNNDVNLFEEVYMVQPDGFLLNKAKSILVCKLKKSIYDLDKLLDNDI